MTAVVLEQGTSIEGQPATPDRMGQFLSALKAFGQASALAAHNPANLSIDASKHLAVFEAEQRVRDIALLWLAQVTEREVALAAQPRTLEDALDAMWQSQVTYEAAQAAAVAAHCAWSAQDVGGSRVRRAAVKKLMLSKEQGGEGMSFTAADKSASDVEEYAAHKDRLAELLDAKLDAEAVRDAALQRLLNVRVTVEAFTRGARR